METKLGMIDQIEKVRENLRKWWTRILKVPSELIFLGGAVIGGLLVAVVTWREMPPLVGVLVGAIISGAFALIIALEARRIQLAATTWARRFQAHQEAFSLWHQCWSVVHEQDQEKKDRILNEASEWWLNNCLYLSEEARNSFAQMISSVRMHKLFLETRQDSEQWKKQVIENWDFIKGTGQTIIRSSSSHISDDVLRRLGPADPYGSEAQKQPRN
jgi:hypothetical protein